MGSNGELEIRPLAPEAIPEADRGAYSAMLEAIGRGVEARLEAARHWLSMSPEAQVAVYEATPRAFRPYWDRLSDIGAGKLHPLLYDLRGRAAGYLARLPVGQQAEYLTGGVPVLRGSEVVMADPSALSAAETAQVFDADARGGVRVRSPRAQKAWAAEAEKRERARQARVRRRKKRFRVERKGRWRVEGDRAVVLADSLTIEDVRLLLRDMRRLYDEA